MKTNNVKTTVKNAPKNQKELDAQKEKVIEIRKDEVREGKGMIDFSKLDFENLENRLSKLKLEKEKTTIERSEDKTYSFWELKETDINLFNKKKRKAQKFRRDILNNMCVALQIKNKEKFEKYFFEFQKFYVDNFSINDYSFDSLITPTTSEEVKDQAKFILDFIKENDLIK